MYGVTTVLSARAVGPACTPRVRPRPLPRPRSRALDENKQMEDDETETGVYLADRFAATPTSDEETPLSTATSIDALLDAIDDDEVQNRLNAKQTRKRQKAPSFLSTYRPKRHRHPSIIVVTLEKVSAPFTGTVTIVVGLVYSLLS